jgi:hypothetical protein
LLQHAHRPIRVVPLVQDALRRQGLYTRERGATESTEFSLTRFLCPALSNFEGWSLFVDCDVLFKCDLADLLLHALAQPDKAVYVCQHDYQSTAGLKFGGHIQTSYPRKNWSSVLLFDNVKCGALTPEYVNNATGLQLHRFQWLDDDQIGALPLEFNWLVGEYAPNPDAKILHFTLGVPAYAEYMHCDHADEWWGTYRTMMKPVSALGATLRIAGLDARDQHDADTRTSTAALNETPWGI